MKRDLAFGENSGLILEYDNFSERVHCENYKASLFQAADLGSKCELNDVEAV